MKKTILLLLTVITLFACRKNENLQTDVDAKLSKLEAAPGDVNDTVYKSDHPKNLTIVYFVPSDMKLNPDYKRRISEFLLYEQNYTKTWMEKWGYGAQTFGLMVNNKKEVEINVVLGKLPTASYPYNGGAEAMAQEINAWFTAKPDKKKSNHVFILTTVNEYGKQNVPFYGVGTWAYAIDFPFMEIANMTKTDDIGKQSEWIGGNFHEMLHGLNLPHNGGTIANNTLYGSPIMSGTGAGFVTGKTYLDAWDCALLSTGETFSKVARTDWYESPSASITKLHATFDEASKSIVVSGRYTSGKKVMFVGFTNDAKRSADDLNYDSENWVTKPIATDSFYVKIPLAEIKNKSDFRNDFRITLMHENGYSYVASYSYQMLAGKPVIDFGDKPVYSKTKWNVVDVSSEESVNGDYKATNLIDGNIGTMWHSKWSGSGSVLPQFFTIDMGAVLAVNRFTFYQRDSHSKLKDINISVSNDNVTWESIGAYSLPDVAGPTHLKINQLKNFRYFKISTSSVSGNTQFATCIEVGAYKD
jgi:hypothetical protein